MRRCPICYLEDAIEFPPSDYEICPRCKTEFGNTDANRSWDELRAEFIERQSAESARLTNAVREARRAIAELITGQGAYTGERDAEGLGGTWCSQCGEEWFEHSKLDNGEPDWGSYIERHTDDCPIVQARAWLAAHPGEEKKHE